MIFSLNETYTFLTPYSQGGLSAKSELHLMQDSGGLWWNSRQNVAAAGVGRLIVLGTEHEPETGPNIRVGADNTWRSVTTHTTDYVCTGSRHSQPACHLGQNNLQPGQEADLLLLPVLLNRLQNRHSTYRAREDLAPHSANYPSRPDMAYPSPQNHVGRHVQHTCCCCSCRCCCCCGCH